MNSRASILRSVMFVAIIVLVAAAVYAFTRIEVAHVESAHKPQIEGPRTKLLLTSDGKPTDTIEVPETVQKTLGITTVHVAAAPPPAPLRLEGSLFLDPNRLTHVHTRFSGEVVEIGTVEAPSDDPERLGEMVKRQVRFGDQVKKEQILAVIWSKDLGEKKSELVDALSRLFLDQETQTRLEDLYKNGAIPERSLREAERNVESDLIAVSKAERTLITWRLQKKDLDEIRDEAARIHKNKGHWDQDSKRQWARVDIRSSIDGTVVEKNIAVGDVVEPQLDLFKVADLTRLDVLAHAYEEDLPQLEDLPLNERHWNVYLKSDPDGRPLSGSFSNIGNIIDPNQHTALVMGWVDNKSGRLRVGQFVTAAIDLPAYVDEVAVPASAVVDEDANSFVFVQPDPQKLRYERRKVWVKRRRENQIYVSSRITVDGFSALEPGESVVDSSSLELCSQLDDLKAAARIASK